MKTAAPQQLLLPHSPHRWRIETPNGTPTSTGRCACGAQQEFYNSTAQDRGEPPTKKRRQLTPGDGIGGFDGWHTVCKDCGEEMARSTVKMHRRLFHTGLKEAS